jgi:hypothetical protein
MQQYSVWADPEIMTYTFILSFILIAGGLLCRRILEGKDKDKK